MSTATKLPTQDRPMTLDPDLAAALEKELEPYSGKDLEAAQDAVVKVSKSAFSGSFSKLLDTYREAIKEAVA